VRTVILGAGGQLATDLEATMSGWELFPFHHSDLDMCDYNEVRRVLAGVRPEAVINTAAFHQVDDCEVEVEKAFRVNAFAVRNMAQVCRDLDCVLVQISTDYVFDGHKRTPYTEEDLPSPLNVYGASKLAGEYFVRNICPKHLVVRTSGLYGVAGSSVKGGNFVETMIRLAQEGKPLNVVDDQVLSPTYTKDLAVCIMALCAGAPFGLYHIANQGQCSWLEFARSILEWSRIRHEVSAAHSAVVSGKARRPAFSALANSIKTTQFVSIRTWEDALADYLSCRTQKQSCGR
jgi:dTDP-4-dehydrorhamnose reductase